MQCFSTYFSWRNVLYCANTIAHYKSKIRRKCMGNLRKKSAFFKLNLQCFSAYLDLRNVWYCAFVVARYKTKKFQNWKKIYIIITLCLTSQAIDSPVLTKLFTWGRHRNTSVTKTCFRHWSCSAVQVTESKWIFTKDYPNFMTVYRKETAKPYGYVLINNQEWETSQTIDKKKG